MKHQPIHVKKAGLLKSLALCEGEDTGGVSQDVWVFIWNFYPIFLFTRFFLPTKKNTGVLGFPFGIFKYFDT